MQTDRSQALSDRLRAQHLRIGAEAVEELLALGRALAKAAQGPHLRRGQPEALIAPFGQAGIDHRLQLLDRVDPGRVPIALDISGGVDYKATNKISVFIKVNNILNSTNQSYLYYPDYGFNIFGGVGYSF